MNLNFSPAIHGLPELLKGTAITIEVTASSLLCATTLGLLLGLARTNPQHRIVYAIASAYVAFVRGTPLLVQLFLLFFGLPQLGILLPAFLCATLGMGLYSASYISEVVRGAIQSVDRGQMEAARSLGLSKRAAMRLVVLPQAFLRMLPALGNEFIALLKNSALVSLLTIDDLMREGQRLISVSFRSLEIYLVVAFLYFVLTSLIGYVTRSLEKRLRVGGLVA